jgi:hypothetical protein
MTTILDEDTQEVKQVFNKQEEREAIERFYDEYNALISSRSLSQGDYKQFLGWAMRLLGHYYGFVKGTHEVL